MKTKKIYSVYKNYRDENNAVRVEFSEDEDIANRIANKMLLIDNSVGVITEMAVYRDGLSHLYILKENEPLNSMNGKTICDFAGEVKKELLDNLTPLQKKVLADSSIITTVQESVSFRETR